MRRIALAVLTVALVGIFALQAPEKAQADITSWTDTSTTNRVQPGDSVTFTGMVTPRFVVQGCDQNPALWQSVPSHSIQVWTRSGSNAYAHARTFTPPSTGSSAATVTYQWTAPVTAGTYDIQLRHYRGSTGGNCVQNWTSRTTRMTVELPSSLHEFSGTVATRDSVWKCISSSQGSTYTVSNAELTVHGFCMKTSGGAAVELHVASGTTAAQVSRFAGVTDWWWLANSSDSLVYYDRPTSTGAKAFTETNTGWASSSRLGFATTAKTVTIAPEITTTGVGWSYSSSRFNALASGNTAKLVFTVSADQTPAGADTPGTPAQVRVTRSDAHATATVAWQLYDAVTTYEIERSTLLENAYGDEQTFTVAGTQEGVSSYEDTTVEATTAYRYRVRASGAADGSWSAWSSYTFTGERSELELDAPGNVRVSRDGTSVTISWSAPGQDFDNYTIQRQELVVVEGSTFFANVIVLGGSSWLPASSTMYDDTSILPGQTYEYRVAAVADSVVGTYSDWFRVSPPLTSLGDAPANLRFVEGDTANVYATYREFWMAWDAVDGADNYEVQVIVHDPLTGGRSMERHIVSDPTYFRTSESSVQLRVRGRKVDAGLCSAAADNTCYTDWTGRYRVRFTPTVEIPAPATIEPAELDPKVVEFRQALRDALVASLEPAGADVDADTVLGLVVVVGALALAIASVAIAWKRGMQSLGVGMGCAAAMLALFVGARLLGTPMAWAYAAQSFLGLMGAIALARQLGVFR